MFARFVDAVGMQKQEFFHVEFWPPIEKSCIRPLLCRTCEAAIAGLEGVDDITDKYNIEFVKVNNKKYARGLGIRLTLVLPQGGFKGPFYVFHGKLTHFAAYFFSQNIAKLTPPKTLEHYAQMPLS